LSYRPEPSGRAIHEEVNGLDIGGHGRRFVHTHRPQGRPYPYVQAGAETPDTGAEAVTLRAGVRYIRTSILA